MGAFNSEKQLSTHIQNFFSENSLEVLVLQCSAINDAVHILMTKFTLDSYRAEYRKFAEIGNSARD